MKKIKKYSLISAIAVLALSVSALAYYVYANASIQTSTRGVVGISTAEANSATGLMELCAQANITDYDLNIMASDVNTKENPTSETLKAYAAAYDGVLTRGETYDLAAYAHIVYMTKYGEVTDRDVDNKSFTFNLGVNTLNLEQASEQTTKLRENYHRTRSEYIFQRFGMNPEEYLYAQDFDALAYLDAGSYVSMKETINIMPGSTLPSFFITEDTEIVYIVFQDANALNHMYKFSKVSNENTYTSEYSSVQDAGRYQDAVMSFSEYEKQELMR